MTNPLPLNQVARLAEKEALKAMTWQEKFKYHFSKEVTWLALFATGTAIAQSDYQTAFNIGLQFVLGF